jgi:hypothetical protein
MCVPVTAAGWIRRSLLRLPLDNVQVRSSSSSTPNGWRLSISSLNHHTTISIHSNHPNMDIHLLPGAPGARSRAGRTDGQPQRPGPLDPAVQGPAGAPGARGPAPGDLGRPVGAGGGRGGGGGGGGRGGGRKRKREGGGQEEEGRLWGTRRREGGQGERWTPPRETQRTWERPEPHCFQINSKCRYHNVLLHPLKCPASSSTAVPSNGQYHHTVALRLPALRSRWSTVSTNHNDGRNTVTGCSGRNGCHLLANG